MDFELISSRKNSLVRAAAALGSDSEERRLKGLFLCEGARLCEDAARSGTRIEVCFFTRSAAEKYEAYLAQIQRVAKRLCLIEDHVAALLSSTKNSQGVFCVCNLPEGFRRTPDIKDGSCAVLENVQDPGNLGTILRTAEALGFSRVYLLGDCCDPLSPKALRASMGAVFRLAVSQEGSPQKLFSELHAMGYRLYAAVPSADAIPVTMLDFSGGLHAVCIGNEGNGLSDETVALCDGKMTVPMSGRAESLNASAAATILLWEMKRGISDA